MIRRIVASVALAASVLLASVSIGLADAAPIVHSSLPERIVIPSIRVNAPVVELGLTEDGIMESPYGPYAAGWYDFSSTPGDPGNAVFSGHRDWHTGVLGVFWRLGELEEGDTITVILADETEVTYAVVESVSLYSDEIDVAEVVGPTVAESITIITCEGTFNLATRDYDQRRIVRAERVYD